MNLPPAPAVAKAMAGLPAGAAERPAPSPMAAARISDLKFQISDLKFQPVPPLVWAALAAHVAVFLAIMLAMTPLTYNLDDIKVTLFLILGPALMLIALGVIWRGWAPWPPKLAGLGLLGYGVVMVVSTLTANIHSGLAPLNPAIHADLRWTGWFQLMFVWSAAGFFLTAFCIGSHRRPSAVFLRALVAVVLLLNLIGFFFFDLTNSPEHGSGVAWLYRTFLANSPDAEKGFWFNIFWTLYNADGSLQSTVLNRDFYAGICTLFLPLALLLTLDPGRPHANFWRAVGLLTALLTALSVFFCQSKGEWIFGSLSILIFAGLLIKVGHMPDLRKRHLIGWLAGILLILALAGWMRSPTLLGQLKNISTSVSSRGIIFGGAWGIFKSHPILGSGPGSFRMYFPTYRRADYFNHEISNVTTYAHNYFLDLLSETGILGLACFLLFLGVLLFLGLRTTWKHPNSQLRLWLAAIICGLIAMYGSNLSSPNARWVIGAVPLWTVMGFLAGLIRQAQGWTHLRQGYGGLAHSPSPRLRRTSRALTGTLAAVGLVAWGFAIPTGVRYFKSAMSYATGLQNMEWAGKLAQAGENDTQKLISLMDHSTQHFTRAIEQDWTNLSAYYKMGSVYTSLAQLNKSIAADLRSKHKDQDAETCQKLSDDALERAKEAYENLIHYDPDYAEIHYNMGIIYQAYAERLRRLAPQSAEDGPAVAKAMAGGANDSRAALLRQAADYEQLALAHLDRMGKLSKKAEVATLLGGQYLDTKYYDKARDIFRDAGREYPEDKQLALSYYRIAGHIKDYHGAGEALERLWKMSPADDSLLDQLVTLALDHQMDDLLQTVSKRLEKINPIHPRLYEIKLDLAARGGRTADVLKAAGDYIRCGGQDLALYQMGAEAAQTLGRPQEARDIYQRILKVDRDNKTSYSALARSRLAGVAPQGGQRPAEAPAGGKTVSTADPATSRSGTPSSKADGPAR